MFNYDAANNTPCGGDYPVPGSGDSIGLPEDYCCIPVIVGCMDDGTAMGSPGYYINYSPPSVPPDPMVDVNTQLPNSCIAIDHGCTDDGNQANSPYPGTAACNYDPLANTDDGTCSYCGDINAGNYDVLPNAGPNTWTSCTTNCLYCATGFDQVQPVVTIIQPVSSPYANDGIISVSWDEADLATSYNLYIGSQQVPSVTAAMSGINISSGGSITVDANDPNASGFGSGTITYTVSGMAVFGPYGPLNSWSYAYNNNGIQATCDLSTMNSYYGGVNNVSSQGYGIYFQNVAFYGCIDNTACNYNPNANTDDGSCDYSFGCTDVNAINYDANALCDDGSCYYTTLVYGCTDSNAFNYDSAANTNQVSATDTSDPCIPVIEGCIIPAANSTITYTNISESGSTRRQWGTNQTPTINGTPAGSHCSAYPLYGQLDVEYPIYSNYVLPQVGPPVLNIPNTHNQSLCILNVYGCMDSTAINYDSTATVMGWNGVTTPTSQINTDFANATVLASGDCGNPCFNTTAGLTYVPDDNLENFIEQNTSVMALADYVNTSDMHILTHFAGPVGSSAASQIHDLTGMEDAINLTHFAYNSTGSQFSSLTNIDLSNSNSLENFNVSGLSDLQTISFYHLQILGNFAFPGNELDYIQVDNCSSLTNLSLEQCGKATSIIVKDNPNLTDLIQPTYFDGFNNPHIYNTTYMDVSNNALTGNIIAYPGLTHLDISSNSIYLVYLVIWPNISQLTIFNATNAGVGGLTGSQGNVSWTNAPMAIMCGTDARAQDAYDIATNGSGDWNIDSGTLFIGQDSQSGLILIMP